MEGGVTDLVALPARTWAGVLRELAAVVGPGTDRDELTELLAGPVSAIASGPGRERVARLLAGDRTRRSLVAERLEAAGEDPEVVAAVRGGDDEVTADGGMGSEADVAPGGHRGDPVDAATRRDLRADLDRLRRQRDGAEARARAAEERAVRAEAARAAAVARADAAEAELARAEEDRRRAVERAERRALDRGRDLATDLAGERSGRERAARALERERERADRLTVELERLRRELEVASAAVAASVAVPPVRRRPVGLPAGIAPDTTEGARHLLGSVDLVIVDGYNLTLRLRPGLDLAAQRSWLLERLRALAARGPSVVVVFDGDRREGTRRVDRGVDVRFSPERRIADDDIEFIAGESTAGGAPTLVVTDDAGLRARVTAHDADVVGVLPFTGAL